MTRRNLLLILAVMLAATAGGPVRAQEADQPTLFVSAPDLLDRLPDAPDGTVAVVGQIALADGTAIVVVVRNATDEAVTDAGVERIVRDMSGTPVATGTPSPTSASAPIVPRTIPPGGIGLALVPLEQSPADDTAHGFAITTGPPDDEAMDLAIPRAEHGDGTLTGIVTAIDVDAAYDPEITAVCVGSDGMLTGAAHATLTPRRIDPYRSVPLRLPLPDDCDAVIAAASAHS